MTTHKKCINDIVKSNMHDFNKKKLKLKNKKVVDNPKQAIAIALSEANKKCTYSTTEIKELYKKVKNDLNEPTKNINLTNIIELKHVMHFLNIKNKINKINKLKNLLWNKIIILHNNNQELNKNIWHELLYLTQ